MVVGYNHNIRYKGEVFHVQTEDSGINSPHIITLLYRGGNIIASKKTSYADIVKMGNLNQIVEELMKEQHKDMLRRLKSAEFDAKLGLEGVADTPAPTAATPTAATPTAATPTAATPTAATPTAAAPTAATPTAAAPTAAAPTAAAPTAAAPTVPAAEPVPPATPNAMPKKEQSLDDLIFDFLSGNDDRH